MTVQQSEQALGQRHVPSLARLGKANTICPYTSRSCRTTWNTRPSRSIAPTARPKLAPCRSPQPAPIGTMILNRSGSARRIFFTVERGQGVTFRSAGFGRLTDRT